MQQDGLHGLAAKANIESTVEFIKSGAASISGWFASNKKMDFDVLINGVRQLNVRHFSRDDTKGIYEDGYSTGWRVQFDARNHLHSGRQTLIFQVRASGSILAERYARSSLENGKTSDKTVIFFIHIPKTGGTSLRQELQHRSADLKTLYVYDDNEHVHHLDFMNYSSETAQEFDIIFGHFDYGLHRNYRHEYKYLSMIRDPYDAILSYYFYMKYNRKDDTFVKYGDIRAAVESPKEAIFDNYTVRMFAGVPNERSVNEEDYLTAVANIERDFLFIGLTERMAESSKMIGQYLGLNLQCNWANSTVGSNEYSALNLFNFRKIMRPKLIYDLMLYKFVEDRFFALN